MAFWVNVDKPTKTCTIHKSECGHVLKSETPYYKGIRRLKRDGGWLSFASLEEAEDCGRRE